MTKKISELLVFSILFITPIFAQEKLMSIIVYDLTPKSTEVVNDTVMLSEMLRNEFIRLGRFQVITRNQTIKTIEEVEFQNSSIASEAGAITIGKMLNAKRAIIGSFGILDGKYYLTLQLFDLETGQFLTAENIVAPTISEIINNMGKTISLIADSAYMRQIESDKNLSATITFPIIESNTLSFITDVRQKSIVQVSIINQANGQVFYLIHDELISLPDGDYTITAKLQGDSEPGFSHVITLSKGTKEILKIPLLKYSIPFRKSTLFDERNAIQARLTLAEEKDKRKHLIGWLSLGIGIINTGVAPYTYFNGNSYYQEYLMASSTSSIEETRSFAESNSMIFSISSISSGLMLGISPIFIFGDSASKLRTQLREVEESIILLEKEVAQK